jgi:hypothetical protein
MKTVSFAHRNVTYGCPGTHAGVLGEANGMHGFGACAEWRTMFGALATGQVLL